MGYGIGEVAVNEMKSVQEYADTSRGHAPALFQSVSNLDSTIDAMEESFMKLGNKLEPLVAPQDSQGEPGPALKESEKLPRSAVIVRVDSASDRIAHLWRQMNDLIAYLQV